MPQKIDGYNPARDHTFRRTDDGMIVQCVSITPDERIPESTPFERGVLNRFQDNYRRPTWKKRKRRHRGIDHA